MVLDRSGTCFTKVGENYFPQSIFNSQSWRKSHWKYHRFGEDYLVRIRSVTQQIDHLARLVMMLAKIGDMCL